MPVATQTKFPYVDWDDMPDHMDWQQGEHITIIAPTGGGKTTLMRELIPYREFVMLLVAKARDDTLNGLEGFTDLETPEPWAKKVLIKPPFHKRNPEKTKRVQHEYFRRALLTAFAQENWAVFADEVRWLAKDLDLADILIMMLLQGRSLGISMVASTQRPKFIPLEFYDQPTHLMLFKDNDDNNLKRLADIGGTVNRQALMRSVPKLERHHFLYVNTRTDEIVESKVEL